MSRTSGTKIWCFCYSFSYIKMGIVSEDLDVTKLVDLSIIIPEHLSLNFYDFSMI